MHKCKNPKYCPICRQKVKERIIKFFKGNPEVFVSYAEIMEIFGLNYITAVKILENLVKKKIIIKKYNYTKRLSIGGGIQTVFAISTKVNRPYKVNSKTWTRIF